MNTITQPCRAWQLALKSAFKDPYTLLNYLDIAVEDLPYQLDLKNPFPLLVTQSFAACMEKGNPYDPLLMQVINRGEESLTLPGYTQDPVKEQSSIPIPGLIHRYHGRALWLLTSGCAIHCRYCFRRHFPYYHSMPKTQEWESIIDYLKQHTEIEELILSGGDPLIAQDAYLEKLIKSLDKILSLKRLRIHSRLPIVLPQRMTHHFVKLLTQTRLKIVIVIHSNHANEMSDAVISYLQPLKKSGILLLNQAVLLKGVNDSSSALIELSLHLWEGGVLPYYLHQLDPVQGSHHFQVSNKNAKQLIKSVSYHLPGYLVPKLVKDHPGQRAKSLL